MIDLSSAEATEAKGTTFAFSTQHVLYGKLRPYLNKVVTPKFEGRCSTELIPLIPKGVSRAFLAWLLRSPQIVDAAMLTTTGSRMPRANLNELVKIKVPLPPLETQMQIAETLERQIDEVDKARAATEAQLEAADSLPDAFLRSAFESEEARTWGKCELQAVCEISTGTTPSTSRKDYYEGNTPFIKTAAITNDRVSEADTFVSREAVEDFRLKIYPKGTVLMAMYGQGKTRGRVALLDIPAATTQNAAAIVPSEHLDSEFLYFWLRSLYNYLRGIGFQGDLAHLSLSYVKKLEIPFPDIAKQKEIVSCLQEQMRMAEQAKTCISKQLDAVNALPASLLRQAFSGELTRQSSPQDLRAALTCLAVERLHHRVFFGVVQLMKVLYFAQVHHGIPLGYTMRRHTYGPFDKAVYDLEKEGERQGWFSVDKAVDKQGSKYVPSAELSSQVREAERALDRWKGELDGLLELAGGFDTTGLEALATLHAAWNDLLLEGRQPNDGEIISEVLEGWPGKKEKFQRGELRTYLAYLKTSPFVPMGTGQSTRLTHAA